MGKKANHPSDANRGKRILREAKAVFLMSLMITIEALAVTLL